MLKNTHRVFMQMDEATAKGESFLFAVNFEGDEAFFIANPLEQNEILFSVSGISNLDEERRSRYLLPRQISFEAFPESFECYSRRFETISSALHRGDSFLANLTIATPICMDASLEEIFVRSKAPYKLYVPGRFVCFSPERFVLIDGNRISSNPMKGTIDARLPNARELLLADYKETSEHYTIVDLLRNDLSMVSNDVHVDRFRYFDEIETNKGPLLQMSSEIAGRLDHVSANPLGTIIEKLLPAGSISGAPKASTLEAIRKAEGIDRGFYSGVFGYFDGKVMDSAVLIRYIEENEPGMYRFRSGGGVTINSEPRDEYSEAIAKVYLAV